MNSANARIARVAVSVRKRGGTEAETVSNLGGAECQEQMSLILEEPDADQSMK